MKEVKAIIQPFMLQKVLEALNALDDLPGVTVSQVIGWGKARGANVEDPVHEAGHAFARKTKLEIVVPEHLAERVADTIAHSANTGRPGDGKIFVYEVLDVLKIRTWERGRKAI